jgi:transposase
VYSVQDWAEVRRLFYVERVAKAAIARRLGMSRNTVERLLGLAQPPRYERTRRGSMLDEHREEIAAMLDQDPKVAATVALERLRRRGYAGGITILKEHLAKVRHEFLAARGIQRTTYLPGEIGHADWWESGREVTVGKGATRKLYALVATLPHSAGHAAVFTHSKTLADVRPALVGCFFRLGGVPEAVVVDNDSSIVAQAPGTPRGCTMRSPLCSATSAPS